MNTFASSQMSATQALGTKFMFLCIFKKIWLLSCWPVLQQIVASVLPEQKQKKTITAQR